MKSDSIYFNIMVFVYPNCTGWLCGAYTNMNMRGMVTEYLQER